MIVNIKKIRLIEKLFYSELIERQKIEIEFFKRKIGMLNEELCRSLTIRRNVTKELATVLYSFNKLLADYKRKYNFK